MSYQLRQNQRDGTRTQHQNVHQQWVPRGSTPSIGSSSTNRPSENSGRSTRSVPQGSASILGNPQLSSSVNHSGENRGHSNMFVPLSNKKVHKPIRMNEGEVKPAKSKASQQNNSNQPQLVQEIQEKLMKGTVECMICYDMVRRSSPIWSCSGCYSIFHLNCIKRWANAPGSVDCSSEKSRPFNWRCPGCQMVQLKAAKDIHYTCFCLKRKNPPSDLYLTPHSCGEPCGKHLEKEITSPLFSIDDSSFCPHLCILQCHPGPCPPCKAFTPPRPCPCGKQLFTTRCADQKSTTLTCGRPCGKFLDCGRHRCAEVCHSGPCDTCRSSVEASCFCDKKVESVSCDSISDVKGELVSGKGVLSCGLKCGKSLGCGNHQCSRVCHPGRCGECELMPERVNTCHCGKTYLERSRKTCLDPIPTCAEICGKPLPCGIHLCNERCHAGSCPSCLIRVTQKCRCGSSSRITECFRTSDGERTFACERPCGRKKNCGRHRCNDRCCVLAKALNDEGCEENPHLCSILCRKKLRCGQHSCELLCHSGHCPPCLETIFTELTCVCGKTTIAPPLPCGTQPPSCQLPCALSLPCGHTPLHSCHFGDCPPCSVLVAKNCVGGHTVLMNIPCGSKEVRCHRICGRTRRCGAHTCVKTCHSPPCDPIPDPEASYSSLSCGQTCGVPRSECSHVCTSPCHPGSPCPDLRCDSPVSIGCSCGRMTANVPCDVGGCTGGFSNLNVLEASLVQKLQSVVESNGKRVPLSRRKLMCDEECAKLERKRILENAFDITQPRIDLLHLGENGAVPQSVLNTVRLDPKWASSVEERCRFLVSSRSRGGAAALKVHVFCPLLKEKRDALRVIAERWKLAVGSAGWEPRRFIVVHVTAKSKPPSLTTLGSRGSVSGSVNAPPFDPVVDMDPNLVVSFLDLPRDADISGLVLRFGGECELVWLDDKNAVAVFNDRARAATAMRRLDHGSTYHGACGIMGQSVGGGGQQTMYPGGGGGLTPLSGNSWKKCVEQSCWTGGDETGGRSTHGSAKGPDELVVISNNRWSALESDAPVVLSPRVDEIERKGYADSKGVDVLENWEEGCI